MASMKGYKNEALLLRRLSSRTACRMLGKNNAAASSSSSLMTKRAPGASCEQQRRWKSSAPLPHENYSNVSNPHHNYKLASMVVPKPATESLQRELLNELLEMEQKSTQEQKATTRTSPNMLTYAGQTSMPVTSKLRLVKPGEDAPSGIWPVFRLMDEDGHFRNAALDGSEDSSLPVPDGFVRQDKEQHDLSSLRSFLLSQAYPYASPEAIENNGLLQDALIPFADTDSTNTLLRAHRQMIRLQEMDHILMNAQRQGRISFYMSCRGEEAIHMGAGSALELQDPILAQYREQGLIMWRGFSLQQFTDQCFSNDRDLGKGRQMPIHYGSRALSYHTVSSPLGTQLPQATGVAYRLKLMGKPNVAVAFLGDGAASTTDFHSALNFAATLKAPVIFFVRNNGYAISTSVQEQYAGDGIVSRAPGYGMAGIRVDGNDIFAVHAAVQEARKYCLKNNAPVLLEAMTYRQSHHSSSDDSSRYRCTTEIERAAKDYDPIHRLEAFLKHHDWLSDNDAVRIRDEEKRAVLAAMEKAEKRPKPSLDDMFTDVYKEIPQSLMEQKQELMDHLQKYPNAYN